MSRNTFFALLIICTIATMAYASNADGQPSLKEVPVSLKVNKTEVIKVFGILEEKTGFKFTYNDAVVPNTKISVTARNSSLYEVLSIISSKENLQFKRVGANIHVTRGNAKAVASGVEEELAAEIKIKGTIKDASGFPLPGVSVLIKGTSTGTITDADGNFSLEVDENATLMISFVGYKTIEYPVGGQTSISIVLDEDITSLNEVIVTATGTRRKVEIGNSIARLDVADEVKIRPINNISDLLQGQAAGVQVFGSGGSTGMGSRIRIRGSSSASLSNEPVIYIDGVLINNQPNSISFETGGQSPSRLNDINPEDIESIEIIKGPSAATLYGSIAANGVIRITTKKGQKGKARWSAFIETGVVNDIAVYPDNYEALDINGNPGFNYQAAEGTFVPVTINQFQPLNDPRTRPFRSGAQFGTGISVSGGTDVVTYFVSGSYVDNEGVLPVNNITRGNIRANIGAKLSDNLTLNVTTGYTKSNLELPLNDNYALGLMGQGLNGFPSIDQGQQGWGEFTPEELFTIETNQNIDRFTSGLNFIWTPTEQLTFRVAGGLDYTSRWDNQFFPTGEAPDFLNYDEGARFSNRFNTYVTTLDLVGTYKKDITDGISSRTSVGLQYLGSLTQGTFASGLRLVPGSSSIAGAAQTFSDEETTEQRTAGFFVEEQVGFSEKLFITAAIRIDRGSSFGPALQSVIYPKISASWLLSDESFFNVSSNVLSSLRLRGAWGASGVQPGTNDALRFYNPVAATIDGQSETAVTFGSVGNNELRPELSTELEVGLDASMFSDRIGLELTYFNKATQDALIFRQLPLSLGVGNGRFENLGSVKNTGVEIGLNTQIVQGEKFAFDLNIVGSFLNNELTQLGEGVEPVIFGQQRHVEGFPLGGYWDRTYTFDDVNGDGLIAGSEVTVSDEATYLGAPFATTELSFMPALRFFNDRIVLTSLLSFRGGQMLYNNTGRWRQRNGNTRELNDPNASLEDQARAVAFVFYGTAAGYIEDASFWRLREVSLTFNAPSNWLSSTFSRMSFTVSGQNLGVWTKYSGLDPEISAAGQDNFTTQEFLSQPPIRMWKARLNLSF
ncbi:MAG: SusC/RagA family TonB-linked outer membrane protein [Cyclobacteriaceae bacterium]|nr:SusC/RagA family TonB-linked outer membrane protein [Cyclobacteriaceae bacterium]